MKFYPHIQLAEKCLPQTYKPVFKTNILLPGIFLTMICFILQMVTNNMVLAQTFDPRVNCTNGCTAKDIKNIAAALVYPTAPYEQLPSNFTCNNGEAVAVKLAVYLTTNTQKAGLYVYANIRNSTTNALLGTVSECFSSGALTTTAGATKVVFNQPLSWTCGTGIKLTDVYVAWGTGNEDFCVGSPLPRCPATTSKCYSLPDGEYVPVIVPVGTPAAATLCPNVPGGTTATFNLHSMDLTILAGQTGTVTYFANSDFSGAIAPNENAYLSGSKTIYAKITSNGVSSSPISIALTVKPSPAAPTLGKVDNCDGTSTITATNIVGTPMLTWSDGGTGNPRTVSETTALTVTQTVDGCPSVASNSVTPAPKSTPAKPLVSVVDNCNNTSTLTITNPAALASFAWNPGGGTANPLVVNSAGSYTVVQTVNGCASATSDAKAAAPRTTPVKPNVTVVDNCNGTSTLTITNPAASANFVWSPGGSTANPLVVNTAGSYTVIQTVNGCPSAASDTKAAAPKTTPAAPSVNVVNNCDGSSDLTATGYTGTLLWSNGQTTASIKVNNAATYTVRQTVSGCQSLDGSGTSAPKTTPAAPSLCVIQPSLCGPATGTIQVLSPAAGDTYSIDNGINWQASNVFSGLAAGSNPSIKVKSAGGCISAAAICSDASDCAPPQANSKSAPVVSSSKINVSNQVVNQGTTPGKQLEEQVGREPTVNAFPNPFADRVKFVINSPTAGRGSLDLYNSLGQKIKTVYSGHINQGSQTLDIRIADKQTAHLLYVLTIGDKKYTGKLMQINQ